MKTARAMRQGTAGRIALRMAAVVVVVLVATACESEEGPATEDKQAEVQDPVWPRLSAVDKMEFTRQKPIGVAPGFNVDGKVSAKGDAQTCGKADLEAPDGEQGIDNEFAKLVPVVEASGIGALEGLIQSTINDGGIMLMLQIDGLDDPADDPEVTLRMRAGKGVPLLGTDGLLLASQTFALHPDSPETTAKAKVVGGVVHSEPFDILLPLVVFGVKYKLDVRNTRVRARLTLDGGLKDGLFGGGITMASILDIAQKGAADQKNLVELVMGVLGDAGDLARDAEGKCQQLSAALAFSAVNAYLFEDTRGALGAGSTAP